MDKTHEFSRYAAPSAILCSIAAKPDTLCTERLAAYMPGLFCPACKYYKHLIMQTLDPAVCQQELPSGSQTVRQRYEQQILVGSDEATAVYLSMCWSTMCSTKVLMFSFLMNSISSNTPACNVTVMIIIVIITMMMMIIIIIIITTTLSSS